MTHPMLVETVLPVLAKRPALPGEIDVSERSRDALMGDAHRLSPVFGRQRERGFQHLARGPAGISNVRASFLGSHACLLYTACEVL